MNGILATLISILITANLAMAQENLVVPTRPKLLLTTGIWVSNSNNYWIRMTTSLETKRMSFGIGVHRLLRFAPSYSNLLVDTEIIPWQLGFDLCYRYYFALEKAKLRPYFLASLSLSGANQMQNPRYHVNPKHLGTWKYLEPTIGYGLSWEIWELFSLGAQVGGGLQMFQYHPKGQKPDPGYWPGGFMGSIMLEKRF
ncbi:MAG: hypothetical protein IPN95_22235 [Bacteroidetes bacterium]|nr:hypothetical protein [Bacteroidota bacterium]MBL0015009.1 hypothetical protein [Bacteroidota bacterium]MBP6720710.1 hypothetical protein [Bacteroidia bacterium]MBP8073201.1 hypothetical protein [Bacteroidia bacterium]